MVYSSHLATLSPATRESSAAKDVPFLYICILLNFDFIKVKYDHLQ